MVERVTTRKTTDAGRQTVLALTDADLRVIGCDSVGDKVKVETSEDEIVITPMD
jgi:hypothetical protein